MFNDSQYRNLIDKDSYVEYLKTHKDLYGILDVHKWLAIRYSVYMPYRKSELDWYFVFLMDDRLIKNEALTALESLHKRPKILYPTAEHVVYK